VSESLVSGTATLKIQTTAEPCDFDVTEHAQAMQSAAVQAGAIR
jgi:hypothetical protein